MTLPRFDVLVPASVEEACVMLAENRSRPGGVRVLAGGSDLLVDLKQPLVQHELAAVGDSEARLTTLPASGSSEVQVYDDGMTWGIGPEHDPSVLVSLHKLARLKRIDSGEDGVLSIGALVTAREIQRSRLVRESWTALAEGADALGSPLVRARGTLGGNICNARPAADMTVPSIGLGARLELVSSRGIREVMSEEFITGPGRTVIEPDEILTKIKFFTSPHGTRSGSAYIKLAQRKALDISVVGAAALLVLRDDDTVADARVSLGAVGPTPLLARSVNSVLMGERLTSGLLEAAADAAAADATPITDHRGGANYRRDMVRVLTRRTLERARSRAGGRQS